MNISDTKVHGILWLKLDERSKQLLQQRFPASYVSKHYDHVTLAYDAARSTVENHIDKPASVDVYAYAKNDKAEAVRVDTHGLPDTYGVPHITLSTIDGVEPFESVTMLKSEHDEIAIEPFVVSGTLEFILL